MTTYEDPLAPLEPILSDNEVMEIMINGHDQVYIEKHGEVQLTDVKFESEEQLLAAANAIAEPLGRVVNESHPIVDVRLADGSRVNIVIPPISLTGTTITIRKFIRHPLSMDDLVRYGSLSAEMVRFLEACVKSRLNVVVAGGTGSGKTTVFNNLLNYIDDSERLVVSENAAEIVVKKPHVIRLESRPPNIEGRGEISMRDLVINSLRMRPDRLIVGEVRSGEVLDLLQAMNTGHDGSMFTIHANSPRDAIARIETMALMAGIEMPVATIREQVASAIDVIVQQQRLRDGKRKILFITEIVGMQGPMISMADVFEFMQTGFENGKIIGKHVPTGHKPRFLHVLNDNGFDFPDDFFTLPPEFAAE